MKQSYLHLAAIVSLCAAMSAGVKANDKLVVGIIGGSDTQISVNSISQITFSNEEMTVATPDGEKKFQLSSIDNIHFDLATSSTDNITAPLGNDISVKVNNGIMSINAPAEVPVSVYVYNMHGLLVTSRKGSESLSIDFNHMAKGAYIVKANNKVIKFTR
ncbi:T9SS type A sorting domain-containing protein [uncultured Muribaculum sp.]|uniref:T9SS type A sorting domain-containing protein n=1 Tax=uncultured Muribaculum sp. TaxID=1918613 RepID=UPI00261176F4|nr:T9SS type A sorting domain-containing protein [uncultured Muribaculum sp.]